MTAAATHRFTFMLDGMGDPIVARDLTRAVHESLGLVARADPAGMWLEIESQQPVDEALSDRVADVARRFAFEPRDRTSSSFVASVTAEQLRQRVAYEWTSRWATGLVFLLPALALHYLTPSLAQGGRLIPGMIEATLVLWSLIAACWPIVWQGLLAVFARRMTPDLFNLAGLGASLLYGLLLAGLGRENTLHVTSYFIIAATLQRLIIWRRAERLQGQSHLVPPARWLLGAILFAGLALACFDFAGGMAVLLAMPAMIALLSCNRLVHPFGALLPPALMSAFLAVAPAVLPPAQLAGRIEAAFGFNVLLTIAYGSALGQRRTSTPAETL